VAWLARNNISPTDYLTADQLNSLANDDRYWGGDVNGGGYKLSNVILAGSGSFESYPSPLQVTPGSDGQTNLQLDSPYGSPAVQTPRWTVGKDSSDNFIITRYTDTGAANGIPLWINRATGLVTIGPQQWTGSVDANGMTLSNVILGSGVTISGYVPTSRTLTAGTGLSGGGDLSANRSFAVVDDTTTQRVRVSNNGTLVGTHREINFIQSSNMTLTFADDGPNNRVNVTFASSGTGGSGSQTPWTGPIDGNNQPLIRAASISVGGGYVSYDLPLNAYYVGPLPATTGNTPKGAIRLHNGGSGYDMDMGVCSSPSPDAGFIQVHQSSNFTNNFPLLLNPNGGNVGIATIYAPTAPLSVNAPPAGSYTVPNVVMASQTADGMGVIVNRSGTANSMELWLGVNQASTYGEIQGAQAGVGYRPLLLNRQGGNVGIGTASPFYLLHCQLTTGGFEIARFGQSGNGGALIQTVDSSNNIVAFGSEAGNASIRSNNTQRFCLTNSGYAAVGGCTNPSVLFVVSSVNTANSPANYTRMFIQGNGVTASDTVPCGRVQLGLDNNYDYGVYFGSMYLATGSQGAGVIGYRHVAVDHPVLYLNNDRLGVGKALPQYTLDVNGDVNIPTGSSFRVNGVAISGGAVSTYAGASPWLGTPNTTRAINGVYTNSTGKPIFVAIMFNLTNTFSAILNADTNTTPSTQIANQVNLGGQAGIFTVYGWILPGQNYMVQAGGSSTINNWREWN
jgi:hypothetical protein